MTVHAELFARSLQVALSLAHDDDTLQTAASALIEAAREVDTP